jgi:endonuclease III
MMQYARKIPHKKVEHAYVTIDTMAQREKPTHHASDYGLDITRSEDDLFRWFLLAYLFGKPIQSSVAARTWQLFIDRHIDTPWAILELPLRRLVAIFHEGRYTRYEEVMSRALRRCMEQLISDYDGSLMLIYQSSETEDEFTKRLQKLYGVGPKTAEIFMRETEELFTRRVE